MNNNTFEPSDNQPINSCIKDHARIGNNHTAKTIIIDNGITININYPIEASAIVEIVKKLKEENNKQDKSKEDEISEIPEQNISQETLNKTNQIVQRRVLTAQDTQVNEAHSIRKIDPDNEDAPTSSAFCMQTNFFTSLFSAFHGSSTRHGTYDPTWLRNETSEVEEQKDIDKQEIVNKNAKFPDYY